MALTKRRKIILYGVSAGIISLITIVLIACLWSKEEKRRLNDSREKDANGNSTEACVEKCLVSKAESDFRDESEGPCDNNHETLTKTE